MAEPINSSLFIGLIIYQAVITIGVVGYVVYLSLSFANYRNLVAKAFAELLKQDEELARRIQHVASSFALMDALFPQAPAAKAPPSKKKEPTPFKPLHNYSKDTPPNSKDRSHLSVIDPKTSKKEDSGNDKGD